MSGDVDPREYYASEWLNACLDTGVNLTQWEEDFLDSIRTIRTRYGDRWMLTRRQLDTLERIYTEKVP